MATRSKAASGSPGPGGASTGVPTGARGTAAAARGRHPHSVQKVSESLTTYSHTEFLPSESLLPPVPIRVAGQLDGNSIFLSSSFRKMQNFAGWPESFSSPAQYWQGGETLKVPRSMHRENRIKAVSAMAAKGSTNGLAFIQGGETQFRNDTDHEKLFRQESTFHYLFGVAEPDCFGCLDLATGRATLFIPRLPAEYAVWMGKIATPEEFKQQYEMDDVRYVDDIPKFFEESKPQTIYLYSGLNSDSKTMAKPAQFDGIESYNRDLESLHETLFECRVTKNDTELELLRYSNKISSEAHITVMQTVYAGMIEYQMESLFGHYCYYHGGMRNASYTAICGCGPNGAVLHYGHAGAPNNRKLSGDAMILNDMGYEYYCYASDITCSFPVSGVFTEVQRGVYEAVLTASVAVMQAMYCFRPKYYYYDEGTGTKHISPMIFSKHIKIIIRGRYLLGNIGEERWKGEGQDKELFDRTYGGTDTRARKLSFYRAIYTST